MSASPPASAASVVPSSPLSSPPSSVPCDDTAKDNANDNANDNAKYNANDELVDVQPSDVIFLETLKRKVDKKNGNKRVVTFLVEIGDKLCVMKVYKYTGYWSQFRSEESAYRLLKEKGFCERGLVPKFYGVLDSIDATLWPELCEFEHNPEPPSAIFIEYIQDAHQVDIHNFNQDNMDRLSAILAEFHSIGLLHGDPYPRNMMFVPGTPRDRVLWLDFDSSSVEDRTKSDEFTEMLFRDEAREMACAAKAVAEDAKTGKIEATMYF